MRAAWQAEGKPAREEGLLSGRVEEPEANIATDTVNTLPPSEPEGNPWLARESKFCAGRGLCSLSRRAELEENEKDLHCR